MADLVLSKGDRLTCQVLHVGTAIYEVVEVLPDGAVRLRFKGLDSGR